MPRLTWFALIGLLAAGCATTPAAAPVPDVPEDCSYAAVDFIHYYDTLDELLAASQEVVIVKVVDEHVGPERRVADDAGSQSRTLTVSIEQTLRGEPPSRFELPTGGWHIDGGHRSPVGCPHLEVGERAFLALRTSDGERGWSATSIYRLVGGQVGDTGRDEPLARRLEAMSERELVAAVRAAG